MNKLLVLAVFISSCAQTTEEKIKFVMGPEVYDASTLRDKNHSESLRMALRSEPFLDLQRKWKRKHPEAQFLPQEYFIPVLSVKEYQIIRERLGPDDIERVARREYLQNSRFRVECIGAKEIVIAGKTEKEYFVKVNSSDLLKVRFDLQNLFRKNGGKEEDFYATTYNPYVVFSMTKPGLYSGGWEDRDTCVGKLEVARD